MFVGQLASALALRQLWGGTFSLGYNREGDVHFLRAAGPRTGFTVHQVDGKKVHGRATWSAARAFAAVWILETSGRRDRLPEPPLPACPAPCEHGASRGHTIGFPTANIGAWDEQILPANGVYATRVQADGDG